MSGNNAGFMSRFLDEGSTFLFPPAVFVSFNMRNLELSSVGNAGAAPDRMTFLKRKADEYEQAQETMKRRREAE